MRRSVGVVLPPDLPTAQFFPYIERAENLGFDELWVVEDCFWRGGIAQAATVLARTRRIRVGIGILPAAARHAVFTTLEVAALADLYPGRLTVGVGHGMPAWMRQIGASVPNPLVLLEEHVQAIRRLLAGERVTFAGRYVHLDDVALSAVPEVVPDVLVGARGPRSMEVAGRSADGVILAEPVTPEYLAVVRSRLGAPGRPPASDSRVVAYNVACIDADDAGRARLDARAALEWIGEPDWAPHIRPLDFADDLFTLRARSSDRREFASRLPDGWVDRLAITGTAADGRARIAALHDAGADSVVLVPAGADRLAALQPLARVLPTGR